MKTEFILEATKKFGEFSIDLIDILLTNYHDSYKKAKRKIKYGPFYKELFENSSKLSYEQYKKKEQQRFYNLLGYLQKQGLVKRTKENNRSKWKITKKGEKKLNELKLKKENKLPYKIYTKESDRDGKLKIVIFDIPEEEKRKRNWLRENLIALGFSMLQKSVWISKNKLPKDFIDDLKNLDILHYVEIFSIDKKGTLEGNF
ncbi:MAG: CRISPR-associated endonuclease Cas2 [Patescibacteria group bacterium]